MKRVIVPETKIERARQSLLRGSFFLASAMFLVESWVNCLEINNDFPNLLQRNKPNA